MPVETIPGVIVRSQSGFFTVQTKSGVVTCHLRGRLKQGKHTGDIAAIGDRVLISLQPEGTGSIETIEPRRKALVRLDPRPQGVYQQVLLANPDQAVFVFACAEPRPHLRMLVRFLVIAEKQGITALIVAIINGHYDAAGFLLNRGADPNLADETGRTALFAAVAANDIACLPEGGRPDKYDFQKLITRLKERMPQLAKVSAGYFAAPGMDVVDLFIGSEGTLGVMTEITS